MSTDTQKCPHGEPLGADCWMCSAAARRGPVSDDLALALTSNVELRARIEKLERAGGMLRTALGCSEPLADGRTRTACDTWDSLF